jgi:hypothetical protein
MKKLIALCFGIMFSLTVHAFTFYATNLPSVVGEYNCSYYSTNNLNVPAMLTLTTNSGGGVTPPGQIWDFSQPQQSPETVLRTDIIPTTNGPDGGDFTNAAYAEQDTTEILTYTNQSAWRYYSITNVGSSTNQGRWYYGSYVTNVSADGLAMFQPPTRDIPGTVTNGQTWSRSTSWNSTIYTQFGQLPMLYEFADTSTVDAQGTLTLPNINQPFAALRVHEIHNYTGLLDGWIPYEMETNQFYYWLVPQLGVAVQITLPGIAIVNGQVEAPPYTNVVERMYYASYYHPTNMLSSGLGPNNLFIQVTNRNVALYWYPLTNSITSMVSTGYQVQAIGSWAGADWQVLGLTSRTNWSDNLSSTQRFYRVLGFSP